MRSPKDEYDTITCFEVIAHVYNQGILLDNIYAKIKLGGRLYLATPLRYGICDTHGRGNFAEATKLSITNLLEYKGFKILRHEVYRSYPFRFIFYGFLQPIRWFFPFKGDTIHHDGAPKAKWTTFGLRPVWKYFMHKFIIFECEKI